jgi:hypothetical protein
MSHKYKIHDQDKLYECIHLNPVTAGFITKAEDWKYSSAKDFCESSNCYKGQIELNFSS